MSSTTQAGSCSGQKTKTATRPTTATTRSTTASARRPGRPTPATATCARSQATSTTRPRSGSVSGSSYTPGPALNGLQAYFFKTPNLDSATSGGRADFVETDPSSGNFAFSWGASGPTELYSGGTNTDYSVRFAGDITLGDNGDPDREYQFQTAAEGGVLFILDGQVLINDPSATWAEHVQLKQRPARPRQTQARARVLRNHQ